MDIVKIKKDLINFFNTFKEEQITQEGKKYIYIYKDQIEKCSNREVNYFTLSLDDLNTLHPNIVNHFINNATRLHSITLEAIDTMINEHRGNTLPEAKDPLDAYLIQRIREDRILQNLWEQKKPLTDDKKCIPPKLLRRYDLCIKSLSNDRSIPIREIKSKYIGKLITLSGIIIRTCDVLPMSSVLTYTCDVCSCEVYQNINGPTFMPSLECISRECRESPTSGRLIMQCRGSKFTKFQKIKIQETSNQTPNGTIPHFMDIHLYGVLCSQVIPGDYVKITGILLPTIRKVDTKFKCDTLLTDVFLQATDVVKLNFSDNIDNDCGDDDDIITKFSDDEINFTLLPNLYEHLAYSIAPEIYGYRDVKKSLLLSLVGGYDKSIGGMKIRGNIHTILIGDPGIAKSQILGFITRLSPRGIYTTGRGSTGVGLTASIIKDPITLGIILESGALVMADKGVCCIDEIDKMSDGDRSTIYEAMEHQTVSIAKAGILTTLNARTTIIAAANPTNGKFDTKLKISENINLSPALLSRFDIIWLLRDVPSKEDDKQIANHITYVHMNGKEPKDNEMIPLPINFIKKYICMCKKVKPAIDKEISDKIVNAYMRYRKEARINSHFFTYISPRVLLGIVRLSIAHAKIRLSKQVASEDVDEAIRLFNASFLTLSFDDKKNNSYEHPYDNVYAYIRDLRKNVPVHLNDIVDKCKVNGIDRNTTLEAIKYYSKQGILYLDGNDKVHLI